MPRSSVLVVGFVATVAVGCSFHPSAGEGTGTNPSNFDAATGVDRMYVAGETGSGNGDACPTNTFMARNLPPDLLIVLDRSGSMEEDSRGMMAMGAATKWAQVTSAINQVVAQSQATVRWGLKFFATAAGGGGFGGGFGGAFGGGFGMGGGFDPACSVNAAAEVPPAPMNAQAIAAAIAATMPGSNTPTRAAVTQAGAYLAANTDANPKYILLATDGQPNCAMAGQNATVDDAAAIAAVGSVAAMGFPTFVIGIATNGMAEDTLNKMAVSGGRSRAGTPSYYPVTNSADLVGVLQTIQGMIALPCQFDVGGVPSNPNAVTVSVGGQVVPMGDWTYGPGMRSVVFPDSGAICMMLMSGSVKDVSIILPCGEVIIP
jgi:hypothetical protein